MAWALYNRGRLLFDAGRLGDGIEDFLAAARAGIELDGFHDSVGRRVVRERGFQSLLDLLSDSSLPEAQRIGFLGALGRPSETPEAMAAGSLSRRSRWRPTV
jgi:hypothetical protein